jgi:hypothetical protein
MSAAICVLSAHMLKIGMREPMEHICDREFTLRVHLGASLRG